MSNVEVSHIQSAGQGFLDKPFRVLESWPLESEDAMTRHLHTAVGDEIRRIEQIDPIRAAEMRMESIEYANEVRGFYDYDEEPDYEAEDYRSEEAEPLEEDEEEEK